MSPYNASHPPRFPIDVRGSARASHASCTGAAHEDNPHHQHMRCDAVIRPPVPTSAEMVAALCRLLQSQSTSHTCAQVIATTLRSGTLLQVTRVPVPPCPAAPKTRLVCSTPDSAARWWCACLRWWCVSRLLEPSRETELTPRVEPSLTKWHWHIMPLPATPSPVTQRH